MLIDAHVHSFPVVRGVRLGVEEVTSERFGMVRRENKGLERFFPPAFEYTGFPREVLNEYLTWCGIEKAVLLQSYVYGKHNDYYFEHFLKLYPDKFRAFALIDPRVDNSPKLVEDLVSGKGFVGIKVELPDLPVNIEHKGMIACCEKLESIGGTLGIDLGWEPDSSYFFQLEGLKKLLQRFPQLRLHLTHFGLGGREINAIGNDLLESISELNSIGNDVIYDISAFPFMCSDDIEYPYPCMQELLLKILQVISDDKIMWGSDAPQILRRCTYAQSYRWVQDCNELTPETKMKILYQNANRCYFQSE